MKLRQTKKLLLGWLTVCIFSLASHAQTATWNPPLDSTDLSGGFYTDLQKYHWHDSTNWSWVGSPPANRLPDENTDVIIPANRAVCWIPEDHTDAAYIGFSPIQPTCKSLQLFGGLYNQASLLPTASQPRHALYLQTFVCPQRRLVNNP